MNDDATSLGILYSLLNFAYKNDKVKEYINCREMILEEALTSKDEKVVFAFQDLSNVLAGKIN